MERDFIRCVRSGELETEREKVGEVIFSQNRGGSDNQGKGDEMKQQTKAENL
jgi:hypothetical protein